MASADSLAETINLASETMNLSNLFEHELPEEVKEWLKLHVQRCEELEGLVRDMSAREQEFVEHIQKMESEAGAVKELEEMAMGYMRQSQELSEEVAAARQREDDLMAVNKRLQGDDAQCYLDRIQHLEEAVVTLERQNEDLCSENLVLKDVEQKHALNIQELEKAASTANKTQKGSENNLVEKNLRAQIAELQEARISDLARSTASVKELQAQVAEYVRANGDLVVERNELQQKDESSGREIEALQSRVKYAEEDLALHVSRSSELDAEVLKHNARTSEQAARISDLESQIVTSDAECVQYNTRISELESEIVSHLQRTSQLEACCQLAARGHRDDDTRCENSPRGADPLPDFSAHTDHGAVIVTTKDCGMRLPSHAPSTVPSRTREINMLPVSPVISNQRLGASHAHLAGSVVMNAGSIAAQSHQSCASLQSLNVGSVLIPTASLASAPAPPFHDETVQRMVTQPIPQSDQPKRYPSPTRMVSHACARTSRSLTARNSQPSTARGVSPLRVVVTQQQHTARGASPVRPFAQPVHSGTMFNTAPARRTESPNPPVRQPIAGSVVFRQQSPKLNASVPVLPAAAFAPAKRTTSPTNSARKRVSEAIEGAKVCPPADVYRFTTPRVPRVQVARVIEEDAFDADCFPAKECTI